MAEADDAVSEAGVGAGDEPGDDGSRDRDPGDDTADALQVAPGEEAMPVVETDAGAPDSAEPRAAIVALCLLALYLIWGSTYLAIRIAIETLPPLLMAGSRFLAAGAVMLAVLLFRGASLPSRAECRNAAIVGVLFLAGGNGGVTLGEQWVSSSIAAAVVASGGIWTVVLLSLLGEKSRATEWMGAAVGFAGVLLLNVEGDLRASPLGAAFLLGATLSWAVGSVLSRRMPLPSGAMATSIEMLAGGVVMLAGGLLTRETIGEVSAASLLAWVYLFFFGSIVAFSAFTYLIRNVRPALATSYAYVNPAVALLLGVVFAGETVGAYGYAGVSVIIAGVAILTLARAAGDRTARRRTA